MASLMDNHLDESNVYNVDFEFVCVLTEKLNHTVEGFTINILVYSAHSDVWIDKMFDILKSNKMGPTKLERIRL